MQLLKYLLPLLLITSGLSAFDDRPMCFKELEKNFFIYEAVGQALSMNSVGQAQWIGIFRRLQDRQSDVEKIIKEKARLMTPNPLEHPFQGDVARELLHDTLEQIFSRTLVESGYFDMNAIRIMFNYIWTQDARVRSCLPAQVKK